jgi:hypothetical protein
VKKIFAFTTPKRKEPLRDYEVSLLYKISEKFNLGDLLEYMRWDEGHVKVVQANFEGGRVLLRYKEGGEAIAEIRTKRKERGRTFIS